MPDWISQYNKYSDSGAIAYPSFERAPLRQSVARVSENPKDDDAGLEVCDSGLREQRHAT